MSNAGENAAVPDDRVTVVCFDRDRTVSVNPSPAPGQPAVPLSWVKYLAHETDADVWATGNPMLREEAGILGMETAIPLWRSLAEDQRADWNRTVRADGRLLLPRRNRLRVVTDLYVGRGAANDDDETGPTHADDGRDVTLLVVDDVNLEDMAEVGWTHYFPWDFVPAVREGTAEVEIPEETGHTDEPGEGFDGHATPRHVRDACDTSVFDVPFEDRGRQ